MTTFNNNINTKWQSLPNRSREEALYSIRDASSFYDAKEIANSYGLTFEKPVGGKEGYFAPIVNSATAPIETTIEKLINAIESWLEQRLDLLNITDHDLETAYKAGEIKTLDVWGVADYVFRLQDLTYTPYGTRINHDIRVIRLPQKRLIVVDNGKGLDPKDYHSTAGNLFYSSKKRIWQTGMYGQGAASGLAKTEGELRIFRKNVANGGSNHNQWGFILHGKNQTDGKQRYPGQFVEILDTDESVPTLSATDGLQLLPIGDGTKSSKRVEGPYSGTMTGGFYTLSYGYPFDTEGHIGIYQGGLIARLSIGLPALNIPITVQDRRPDKGYQSSLDRSAKGIDKRLEEYPADVVLKEHDWIKIGAHEVRMEIMVLNSDRSGHYLKSEDGVLFTDRGQTQARLPRSWFARSIFGDKLKHVKKFLLVKIYTDNIPNEKKVSEWIYDTSRGRLLQESDKLKYLKKKIEESLLQSEGLKRINSELAQEKLKKLTAVNKDQQSVMDKFVGNHPGIVSGTGNSIVPIDTTTKETQEYPDYIRLVEKQRKKLAKGPRQTPKNFESSPFSLESDANDDYMHDRAKYALFIDGNEVDLSEDHLTVSMQPGGIIKLEVTHPLDKKQIGQVINYELTIWDEKERNFGSQGSEENPFKIEFSVQFGPEKLKTPYAKPIKPITPVNNSDGSPEFKWVDEDVSIYPYFKDNELFDLDTDEQDGKPAVTILANQNNNNFQKFIAKSGEDQRVAERDKNKAMLLIMTNAMSVYHHNKETKEQEKLLNYKKISEPLSQSLLYVFEIDKDVA